MAIYNPWLLAIVGAVLAYVLGYYAVRLLDRLVPTVGQKVHRALRYLAFWRAAPQTPNTRLEPIPGRAATPLGREIVDVSYPSEVTDSKNDDANSELIYEQAIRNDADSFAQTFMITTTVSSLFVAARPATYIPNRISLSDLQNTIRNVQFSNRGFSLPVEVSPPFANLEDGIQRIANFEWLRDELRLHSSGLFTYVRVNPEDVRDQNNYQAPRVMGLLYIIKSTTAAMCAVRNLSRVLNLRDDECIAFQLGLGGLIGRSLVNDQPQMFDFQQGEGCHQDGIKMATVVSKADLEKNAVGYATDFILKALWHFNHAEISRESIVARQADWLGTMGVA